MDYSRRDFVRMGAAALAGLGLSGLTGPAVREALAAVLAGERPPVLWLQGQACTGCTVSFLNSEQPDIAKVLLDIIGLAYHATVMAGEGATAYDCLREVAETRRGQYILVLEGAIPTRYGGQTCIIAEDAGHHVSVAEAVAKLAPQAALVLAVGTCAAFGGVPAAHGGQTGAMGAAAFLAQAGIQARIVNVPGCPPHPEWVLGTLVLLLEALSTNTLLPFLELNLDPLRRVRWFYRSTHLHCPNLPYFEKNQFCRSITDKVGCRYILGCKGPSNACSSPRTWWNGHVNWCIANGTCVGCTSAGFPDGVSPFYQNPGGWAWA